MDIVITSFYISHISMHKKIYRNIPLLYIYSIFIKRVSMPIIVLYFLFHQLSFTQIGILAATISFIQIITEIHGGIFADIHGKKTSLILHSVFGALTMFFYFIGDSFSRYLLASIMYWLAWAFITGTRNSLLYDTLKQLKRTSEFKKFNGKVLLYSHIFNAWVLLIIPFLYDINNKLPFLIGIGFFLISLIIALFFIEPPLEKKSQTNFAVYHQKLLQALKEIKINKKLLFFIVFYMITAAFIYMSSWYNQPLLQISWLDIIYFGVIYASMRVIMGVGGIITHKLEQYLRLETLLLIWVVGMGICFLMFSLSSWILLMLSIIFLKFFSGINRITLDDEINKHIDSENRTTILSISSLSNELFKMFLILIFWILADIIWVQAIFFYVLGIFIFLTILLALMSKKYHKH